MKSVLLSATDFMVLPPQPETDTGEIKPMKTIAEMTSEIYRESTGQILGFDDYRVVEALSAAIEKRIQAIPTTNLSNAQMTVINDRVPIGCNISQLGNASVNHFGENGRTRRDEDCE